MDSIYETFADLVEHSDVLLALYDETDRLRLANDAFRRTFHLSPGETPSWTELMRRNHGAFKGTAIQAADLEAWLTSAQSRRGKTPFRAYETDLVDGRWLWMTETVRPNGWMLCIASEITDLRREERLLRQDLDLAMRAAQTDELTSTANRRFVFGRLEALINAAALIPDSALSICLFDIDLFKSINDRFGHQAGDMVLRHFTNLVHRVIRRTDCFGRIGGEEFMLVMPGSPSENALAFAGHLLAFARAAQPLPDRPAVNYTCSAGVAAYRPGDTAAALYGRADRALYRAKAEGRDRALLSTETLSATGRS
ncbi:GGDEF domain-containing protein [Hyphomicrobiales bacterium]|nr:GGDEF domain-containing protein [Hyphomicrobiales bacterium]CAH1697982.1 GGDEF domain-containing protein [Hyphomicrobiales bacterium]CAI0347630.1 GGDEF domain-containing protein [Hyphomicrobiales bacterium]